ncbi:MAG: RlmE family RNA methyltransferase [Myxococcales bacterium]|nr:RlmE family RNA methyltransferase [Myxococcales bacterium]
MFKLDELNQKFRLIGKNQIVVDLGCAPGSWLQYLAEHVGRKGLVLGYDVAPVELSLGPKVQTHIVDVTELSPERVREDLQSLRQQAAPHTPPNAPPPPVDALLSDMAPKLSGIRDADQAKSVALVEFALQLSRTLIRPGQGVFVAKFFQGRDSDQLVAEVKRFYSDVKLLKPEATREGSREVFVLGRRLRPSK